MVTRVPTRAARTTALRKVREEEYATTPTKKLGKLTPARAPAQSVRAKDTKGEERKDLPAMMVEVTMRRSPGPQISQWNLPKSMGRARRT